jgi:plasmid replication initiation protein
MPKFDHVKEGQDLSLTDRHVNMSNTLVRAAQGLTLAEKRVMASAVAKLDSVRHWTPEKLKVRLAAMEYAEAFDLASSTAYEELQSAADKLFHRYIRWTENTRRGPKEVKMHWVAKATYHHGEGWIELVFHHEIAPHLFLLRKQFTSYKLAQASALRSLYSWRLLELLMQFKSKGWLSITIEDFVAAMEAPASCRKDFGQLRRRVIEPAVRELAEKDGLIAIWQPEKAGRRVKALHFTFEPDPQQRLEL